MFDLLRSGYGSPINVGYAFRLPREGGHWNRSEHYAGLAFDSMQGRTNAARAKVREVAKEQGKCTYIEPVSMSPTWVHTDVGFPRTIKKGSLSVYTFVLQDSLDFLGYPLITDGSFGPGTEKALIAYQKKNKLSPTGVCDGATWKKLGDMVAVKRGK
jgi:peptidoglycan hydrolase-like protein with peptidoglycan-binding domain